jgi:hypothetical protein
LDDAASFWHRIGNVAHAEYVVVWCGLEDRVVAVSPGPDHCPQLPTRDYKLEGFAQTHQMYRRRLLISTIEVCGVLSAVGVNQVLSLCHAAVVAK